MHDKRKATENNIFFLQRRQNRTQTGSQSFSYLRKNATSFIFSCSLFLKFIHKKIIIRRCRLIMMFPNNPDKLPIFSLHKFMNSAQTKHHTVIIIVTGGICVTGHLPTISSQRVCLLVQTIFIP